MTATRHSAVAVVYPGRRHLLRRLKRASMSCGKCFRDFCISACFGGNADTVDSPAPPADGRRSKGKRAAPEGIPLNGNTFTDSEALVALKLDAPTQVHPLWPTYSEELQRNKDARKDMPMPARRADYSQECQQLYARMIKTEPEKYGDLQEGITVTDLAAPRMTRVDEGKTNSQDWTSPTGKVPRPDKSIDDGNIPITKFSLDGANAKPSHVIVYYHGGGLLIGDALSEQLSCRFILRHFDANGAAPGSVVVYSVDYRLKIDDLADVCVHDSIDAYDHIRAQHDDNTRFYIVGSSSGGELAAFVGQHAKSLSSHDGSGAVAGVVLRAPVTSDAFTSHDLVPEHLRDLHTTANEAFFTTQLAKMSRMLPRDGLKYMPLEAPQAQLQGLPPHWIQISTNDALYSDGLCYAKLVRENGGVAAVHSVESMVHTGWLLTPQWKESYEAELQVIKGLNWLAGGAADVEWK